MCLKVFPREFETTLQNELMVFSKIFKEEFYGNKSSNLSESSSWLVEMPKVSRCLEEIKKNLTIIFWREIMFFSEKIILEIFQKSLFIKIKKALGFEDFETT